MNLPFKLYPRLSRRISFFKADAPQVPSALLQGSAVAPDFCGVSLPLPCKKTEFSCYAVTADGARWFGGSKGITRYDPENQYAVDRVMYFSAHRDLLDNNVKNMVAEGNNIWALTEQGVSKIEMLTVSAMEKAEVLTAETLKYVDRYGMTSQKELAVENDLDSAYPYASSDNDGTFTVGFCVGEIYKYAYFKKTKGLDAPETKAAKATATRALEACLLLMWIPGRGDGFVARSYHTPTEPVPDDGFFLRKEGGIATVIETTASKQRGYAGATCNASAPIPDRLAHLYRDAGFSDDGIIYKADTSSDEISHHFLNMWLAHDLLTCDDPELDAILVESCKNLMNHIIDNGFVLRDFTGKATTWARWDEAYFNTPDGWVDACLNSAQLLMYLQVTMHITGEQGKWRKTYDELVAKGYADLGPKHFERMFHASLSMGSDYVEEIMYGDHMLATCAFFGLCMLEKDESLLAKYRKAYKSWRTSMAREHNPGYDFPFALACPEEEIDLAKIGDWLARTNMSRLASGVSIDGRHDMPVIHHKGGYKEAGFRPQSDERFVSKYDRNPFEYTNLSYGGADLVENCYVYTFGYWMGMYYGFIE